MIQPHDSVGQLASIARRALMLGAPTSGVYRPRDRSVNLERSPAIADARLRLRRGGAALGPTGWLAVGSLACLIAPVGCATLPAIDRPTYRIVMRYDVEPVRAAHEADRAWKTIDRDFEAIASDDIGEVLLVHVDDPDRVRLLDIADRYGLRVSLSDRRVQYFVTTGRFPNGCRSLRALLDGISTAVSRHPAMRALAISATNERAIGRLDRVRAALAGRTEVFNVNTEYHHAGFGAAMSRVHVSSLESAGGEAGVDPFLSEFHAGLIAGRTGGLLIERYRRVAGDPPGVVRGRGAFGPSMTTSLRAVVIRARRWGGKLAGARPTPLSGEDPGHRQGAKLTTFVRGKRRYLLVFNAGDGYLRDAPTITHDLVGAPIKRAVEIPPTSVAGAGRVRDARNGRLTIPVNLRPGDAVLYELF